MLLVTVSQKVTIYLAFKMCCYTKAKDASLTVTVTNLTNASSDERIWKLFSIIHIFSPL